MVVLLCIELGYSTGNRFVNGHTGKCLHCTVVSIVNHDMTYRHREVRYVYKTIMWHVVAMGGFIAHRAYDDDTNTKKYQ